MNARIANALVVVVTILVMVGMFELVCRTVVNTGTEYHIEMWKYAVQVKRLASNPEIGHEHTPNSRARLMGADVSINSLGLRDREFPAAKPAGTRRILMLGDSITFGWGVDQDKTASVVLEQRLKAAGQSDVQVINSGVGNYNTAMEVAYFRDHGAALVPDVVVLNYFINDGEPTPAYRDVPTLARHAYVYPVAGGAWDDIKRRFLGGPDWKEYYSGLYDDTQPGWQKTKASIEALAQMCRERGIRLIVANVPELHILAPYPFTAVSDRVAAVAKAQGLEYLDLLPSVAQEDPSSLWVTVPDPHPNARAQALMGNALADYLLSNPAASATP